jgi:uncharacterized Zn finger protein
MGSVRQHRGFLDRLADLFSPTMTCDTCGLVAKQRHFERTGEEHQFATGAGWFRAASFEVEYRCPICGTSQWSQEIQPAYPLF